MPIFAFKRAVNVAWQEEDKEEVEKKFIFFRTRSYSERVITIVALFWQRLDRIQDILDNPQIVLLNCRFLSAFKREKKILSSCPEETL